MVVNLEQAAPGGWARGSPKLDHPGGAQVNFVTENLQPNSVHHVLLLRYVDQLVLSSLSTPGPAQVLGMLKGRQQEEGSHRAQPMPMGDSTVLLEWQGLTRKDRA